MIASKTVLISMIVFYQQAVTLLSFRLLAMVVLTLVFTACSKSELILDGERTGIISSNDVVLPDPAAFAEGAGLTESVFNPIAGHPGLNPGHVGGNVNLNLPLVRSWRSSIGDESSDLAELAQPVVADDKVFTVAPNGLVTAFNIKSGKPVWQVSIEDFVDDPLPGIAGGLAVNDRSLFVHAGGKNLAALSIENGSSIWSVSLQLPVRGGPTIVGAESVVITDLDGNIFAHSQSDGSFIWERAGLPVSTVVYGAPSPAFARGQLAVAGYGGDISIVKAESGQLIWSDSLAVPNRQTPLQSLGDIRAHPIHDGGLIFAVSQAGRVAAFNALSGLLVWSRPIGGIEMPWLAGKTLFLLTIDGRLYALRRNDGEVRWVVELPGALPKGIIAAEDIPRYVGPVVVNGQVMVISQSGSLFSFDANTGVGSKILRVASDIVTPPQLGGGMMFVLSKSGKLTAFD